MTPKLYNKLLTVYSKIKFFRHLEWHLMKLTKTSIANIQTTNKVTDYHDNDVKGLILRVSKTWVKSFRLRYSINGCRKIYTIGQLGAITLTQAKKEAQRLNGLIAQGIDIASDKKQAKNTDKITLKEYIDSFYFSWYKKNNKNTIALEFYLGKPLKKIMNKTLNELNNKNLMIKYLNSYQIENNTSDATYNRMLSTVKGMFSRAYEFQYIQSNNIKDIKPLKINIKKIRYLSNAETERFFGAIDKLNNIQAREIIKIAYFTGMRKNEILSLSADDIDLNTNQIVLKSENTKSSKIRYIPMHKDVLEIVKTKKNKSKYLFISEKTDTKYHNINKSWKKLMSVAQIENFRFHDLRHNFCSMLVMKGVPIYTVAQLAGHADVKTTQIYAHLSPDVKKSAIDLL